jgi:hypothetical protein
MERIKRYGRGCKPRPATKSNVTDGVANPVQLQVTFRLCWSWFATSFVTFRLCWSWFATSFVTFRLCWSWFATSFVTFRLWYLCWSWFVTSFVTFRLWYYTLQTPSSKILDYILYLRTQLTCNFNSISRHFHQFIKTNW